MSEQIPSKERSPEDQRRQAFSNFMAALDAKDIPMSMAATFQAGWDACMRRRAHETRDAALCRILACLELREGPLPRVQVTAGKGPEFWHALSDAFHERPAQKASAGQLEAALSNLAEHAHAAGVKAAERCGHGFEWDKCPHPHTDTQ